MLFTLRQGIFIFRPVTTQAEPMRGNQAPNYLGKHKRHTTQSIANEAREVVKAVKSLIEVERELPSSFDIIWIIGNLNEPSDIYIIYVTDRSEVEN